jgi:hypothetical protein
VDVRSRHNGDEDQRARLARILRDPSTYFAHARRCAHEQARRLLDARLGADGVAPVERS